MRTIIVQIFNAVIFANEMYICIIYLQMWINMALLRTCQLCLRAKYMLNPMRFRIGFHWTLCVTLCQMFLAYGISRYGRLSGNGWRFHLSFYKAVFPLSNEGNARILLVLYSWNWKNKNQWYSSLFHIVVTVVMMIVWIPSVYVSASVHITFPTAWKR